MTRLIRLIKFFALRFQRIWTQSLLPLFDLKSDLDEAGTLEMVVKAIDFKGAGVWTLFFAILIASIGLNVNSTAVIIGAMLISPLMGPIVGAGVALAINHFSLFKQAIRNLVIATGVGILTSFLYFLISPLGEAQSELLARVQPTIYDALIALCGGATGIIANSRKEKGIYALSGVSIATALMPPLCTAGYGLSQGNFRFVAGALYLYLINSLYICLSTFLVVTFLGFKKHVVLQKEARTKLNKLIGYLALIILLPSFYTGYLMVNQVLVEARVNRFVEKHFNLAQTRLIGKEIKKTPEGLTLEVSLIGRTLTDKEKKEIEEAIASSSLKKMKLSIVEMSALSLEEMENRLKNKGMLAGLGNDIKSFPSDILAASGERLIKILPQVAELSGVELPSWLANSSARWRQKVVFLRWNRPPQTREIKQAENFLKESLDCKSCSFVHW